MESFAMGGVNLGAFERAFAAQKKGAGATRHAGTKTVKNFDKFVQEKKWKNVTPQTLSSRQVRSYVLHRLGQEVSPRTVQNEVSHLRRIAAGAGQKLGTISDAKNNWGAARLGLPDRIERATNKPSISSAQFEKRIDLKPEIRVVLELESALGLRAREAVLCPKSLNEWSEKLSQARDDENLRLTVVHGTKGGRPRDVFIQPDRRDEALQVVEQAREIVQKNIEQFGKEYLVIPSPGDPKTELERSLKKVENAVRYAGFTGSDSQHGIRRDFAQKNYQFYREEGLSENDAMLRASMDLGHGRTDIIPGHYLNGGEG
jgi:site-specific recombinase XerD